MKIQHLIILGLLLGAALFALSTPLVAHAVATITVDTLADENDGSCSDGDCSLRDAIAVAAPGDTIDFGVGVTGTITLTLGKLTVGRDLTICGPGTDDLTISGNNASVIFWISDGVSATISALTIADGHAQDGGGLINLGGSLTMTDCVFSNNVGTVNGGGIMNFSGSTLNVSNCRFTGNHTQHGGGICNYATLNVSHCTFADNCAGSWGGGIYNWGTEITQSTVTVTGSTFSGNVAYGDGGGILNHNGTLTVSDCTFSDNSGRGKGGGIYNGGELTVSNSTFSSNAAGYGGGLYSVYEEGVPHVPSIVSGSVFSSNTASVAGGGIYSAVTLAVTNGTVYSNTAGDVGGGIYNNGALTVTNGVVYSNTAQWGGGLGNWGTQTVMNSTVYSNTAINAGGGIYNDGALTVMNTTVSDNNARWGGGLDTFAALNVTNSTFSNNRATESGGGISSQDALTVTNSTFYSNTAGDGAGLCLAGSEATLRNSVVADNHATGLGSGLYAEESSLYLLHSTIARNGGGDGSGLHVAFTSTVALTNTILVSHTVGITVAAGSTATLESTLWYGKGAHTGGAGVINTNHNYTGDPAFAPDGYHITADSAAIDKGVDAGVTTDIDGQRRPNSGTGIPDLGADEYYGGGWTVYLPLVLR